MKNTHIFLGTVLLLILSLSVFSQETDSKKDDNKTGSGIGPGSENSDKNTGDKQNSPIKILSKPAPKYTEEARRNNTQGRVVLEITFQNDRKIGEINVIQGLPDGLNEMAIKAAKGIKFKPEIKNGEAITVIKKLVFSFIIF